MNNIQKDRLTRLREQMRVGKLDCTIITDPVYIAALFKGALIFNGTRPEPPGRVALVVTADEVHVLANRTECARIANEALPKEMNIISHPTDWHRFAVDSAVAEWLQNHSNPSCWADSFGDQKGACRTYLENLLYPLEKFEILALRDLGSLVARILEKTANELEPGLSEQEVAADIHRLLLRQGALPDLVFVAFDERIRKYRHCRPGKERLHQSCLLSITASRDGLFVSASRLVTLGKCPEELAKQVHAANRIEAAAVSASKLGIKGSEVFEAIKSEYAAVGDPEGWREHHLGGPSGFRGRDAKAGPNSEFIIKLGQPFVYNPVVGAGKSEDTWILEPETGDLICLTRDSYWPLNDINIDRFGVLQRPGVLELPYGKMKIPARRIGIVGLGRMGARIATRLASLGMDVHAFDIAPPDLIMDSDVRLRGSIPELCEALGEQRIVLLMVPAKSVDDVLYGADGLAGVCHPGDIIVDMGNSHYTKSIEREKLLAERQISFVDCGISGGLLGASTGLCVAAGGQVSTISKIRYILEALSSPECFHHVGPPGTGHFLKMIHNGIEYGFLQAAAEGIALAATKYQFTGFEVATVWSKKSIIESRIMEIFASRSFQELEGVKPSIGGGETGAWALEEAIQQKIPMPVLAAAVMARNASTGNSDYSAKLIALARWVFGGHSLET
jgi:6-phosphogluconate dehydrogenase